jgi:hypothetical protein
VKDSTPTLLQIGLKSVFLVSIFHFVKSVKPTIDEPVVLLWDGQFPHTRNRMF